MRLHAFKRIASISAAAAIALCAANFSTPAQAYDPDTFRGTNGVGLQVVNMKSEGWGVTMDQVEASYKRASELGVEWVRIGVAWYNIQRGDYRYKAAADWDWKVVDQSVQVAQKYNMKVMMQVTTAPTWATGLDDLSPDKRNALPKSEDTWAPTPAHYDDFGNFLAETVKRYSKQGILDYEIWNEPGCSGFWKNSIDKPIASPEAYTALLKASYPKAKQAVPEANIIAGGSITYHTTNDGNWIDALEFTQRMYAAGAKNYFDSLGHHPYGIGAKRWEWNGWNYIAGTVPGIENADEMPPTLMELMEQNGDGHKPIWITEVGEPSINKEGSEAEAAQARDIEAYLESWRNFPHKKLGPIILYQDVDYHNYSQSKDRESFFGISRVDGSLKPSADEIREFTDANPAPAANQKPSPSTPVTTEPEVEQGAPLPPPPAATTPQEQPSVAPVPPTIEQETATPWWQQIFNSLRNTLLAAVDAIRWLLHR